MGCCSAKAIDTEERTSLTPGPTSTSIPGEPPEEDRAGTFPQATAEVADLSPKLLSVATDVASELSVDVAPTPLTDSPATELPPTPPAAISKTEPEALQPPTDPNPPVDNLLGEWAFADEQAGDGERHQYLLSLQRDNTFQATHKLTWEDEFGEDELTHASTAGDWTVEQDGVTLVLSRQQQGIAFTVGQGVLTRVAGTTDEAFVGIGVQMHRS